MSMNTGLTITAPRGAQCSLYAGTPAALRYCDAIDPQKVIAATQTSEEGKIVTYQYTDLLPGVYHCAASMEGHSALCQVLNYTGTYMHIDMHLDKLAGNGYEAGYAMRNTQAFNDKLLVSHKNAWGESYAELFQTPQFLRPEGRPGRHQQTTNEEMADFIAKLSATNKNMYVFSLGKSPKYGYDMPLVLFTQENVAGKTLEQAAQLIRKNGKPTIQYTAQCHSTEPASTEGALAMMVKLCGDYGKVLKKVDVYIIPRLNPDGAFETIRQSPTTMQDMNRDFLYMQNREVQMAVAAYNLFLPEVAIDGHERKSSVMLTDANLCTDMEVMVSCGSLNHPAPVTKLAMEMSLQALCKGRELGLRCHYYTRLASAAGGAAGSSYYGTRNSLSFLVETPGQLASGMFFMERRVLAQYVLASTVIDYTAQDPQLVLDTVHASREKMTKTGAIYDENNLIVLEHGKSVTGTWKTPLVDPITGETINADHTVDYAEHTIALKARPRATAYVIPKGLEHEEEILRLANNHAIGYYELHPKSVVNLRQYAQSNGEVELNKEREVCFENGAYVFPNTVPSTILGVIMEPDYNSSSGRKMTLLSMGYIAANEEGLLPIFRYCHDLVAGKVSVK